MLRGMWLATAHEWHQSSNGLCLPIKQSLIRRTTQKWAKFHSSRPAKVHYQDADLVYPEPSSTKHKDLPSFLQYAKTTGLDPNSTTYIGTLYEYTVALSLEKYGFSLRRVGGSSDYGIDLLGRWSVPSSTEPLKVLLQCKALSGRIGPHLIRELEGAFVGAPSGWRGSGVVGFLVTERPATKGIRDSMGRSRWPMGFLMCSREGEIQQFLWNRRAEEEGLTGLGVGVQYSHDGTKNSRLTLTWQGQPFDVQPGTGDGGREGV